MQKMSTKEKPQYLSGPTMGTTWQVVIEGRPSLEAPALTGAIQKALCVVEGQMSNWCAASDLMRFNVAPINRWIDLPATLIDVLKAGIEISRQTGGAFEMNVGAAVRAWGFCGDAIDFDAVRAASANGCLRASDTLFLDEKEGRALKSAPIALDLGGIAKGYGVDMMGQVLSEFGITSGLVSLDGEMAARGIKSDGTSWAVALEQPDSPNRRAHSHVALQDVAIATSGDYRHFLNVKGHRLSHTIDPKRSSPLTGAPASVSVIAQNCLNADALATALMVMGPKIGCDFARQNAISALFLMREVSHFSTFGTGLFDETPPITGFIKGY